MQITFDTENKRDLAILNKLMDMAIPTAQPEVASNTGTTGSGLSTLSADASGVSGEAVQHAASPAPEKKGRAKKSAPSAEAQPESSEASGAADTTATATTASPTDKPLTLDEVRAALQAYTASKGVPAGIELLKKYGAGRISELAEGDFAAFVADCA